MAVINVSSANVRVRGSRTHELTRENTRVNTASLYALQGKNQEAIDTLNKYNEVVGKGGWLSSDDIASYRSALDNFVSSSNRLRELNRFFSDDYVDDSEDWKKTVSSMEEGYRGISDFYSKWKDEDEYKTALEAQKEYQKNLNYDIDAARREIEEMKSAIDSEYDSFYNETDKDKLSHEGPIQVASRIWGKDASEWLGLSPLSREQNIKIDELKAAITAKEQEIAIAERIQKAAAIRDAALNAPDFAEKSKYNSTVSYSRTWWDDLVQNPSTVSYDDELYEWINGNEDVKADVKRKDSIASSDNPYDDGKTWLEKAGYDFINDEERAIYNYIYATAGKDKAKDYLDSIADSLQYRYGKDIANGLKGKTLQEYIFGIEAGIDQFASGVAGIFADGYTPQSATQVASGLVREDLKDKGPNLPDWLGGASLGQVGYDAVTTTSNMLPSILASTAVNFVAPGAGAAVGAGLLGASAGGNAKVEMLNLGYSQEQATIYGVLVGAAEGGMEHLLGGIGALGGKLSGKAVSSIASKVDNAIARVAIKLGNKGGSILKAIAHGSVKLAGNMVSEGFEEGLQEIIDPWLREIATGVDWDDPNIDEVLYSSLLGALSAAGLEGAGVVSEEVNTYKSGKAVQGVYAGVEKLQDVGKLLPADSVAYKIADKVNAQTDAYTIGRLLYEAGGTLSEQNISDITGSLVEKGIERKNAERLAKRYKVILDSGMELSDNGRKILESADPLAASLLETIIGKDTEVYQRTKKYSELLASLGGQASAQAVPGGSAVENASVNQSAAEGKFTASEAVAKNDGATAVLPNDGASVRGRATMVDSDGEVRSVKVQKVASIDNGVISLELEDGQVVKASDIELDSETDALLYDAVTRYRMSAQDANAFVATYYETSSDMPIEHFTRGFGEAYTHGKYGISERFLTAEDSIAAELSEPVRNFAYNLGKKEGERTAAENQNEVDAKKEASKGDASAKNERKKGGWLFYDGINKSGLTERQRVSAKSLEVVAKALGVNIHLYESSLDSEGNRSFTMKNGTVTSAYGWYDVKTGDIYIDINSGVRGNGVMLFTAAHELVHDIAVHAPAKFKILADFLMEQYDKKGVSVDMRVQAQIDKAARDGRTIDYDTAYEEVIADSCESLLSDGDVIKKLAELKARDKGLVKKIKSFITKLVARIKKAYAGMKPDSYEGRIVSEMVDEAERLKELFADALLDASEARASGAKVEKPGVDIMYSVGDFSSQVDAVLHGDDTNSTHLKIMDTPSLLQKAGLPSLPILMTANHLKKITSTSGHGLDIETVKKLPQYITEPVMIADSLTRDDSIVIITEAIDAENRPVIAAVLLQGNGRIDGKHIEANIMTSAYGKDNFQSFLNRIADNDSVIYWNEKKSQEMSVSLGLQLPNALTSLDSNVIIRKARAFVNSKSKENSENISENMFSGRDPIDIEQYKKVNRQLEKENAELKEDVVALKELVKLQRQLTHGQVLKPSSLDAVSRKIMRESNAKGDTKEFSRLLSDVYQYIINGQDVTWEGIIEKSQPAVQWLLNHEGGVAHRTEFAQEVLSFFKGYSFSLSEGQKSEVANQYGSFNDFRKRAFGSLSINKNATSLDSLWGEICEAFPSLFDPETSDKDQPLVLMSVIDSMKNSYQMEFEFDDDMRAQELLTKIYDGYWAVSTLHTVADSMQVQINRLKYKHSEQMSQIKTSHENSVAELKRDFQKRLDSLKRSKEERYNKTVEHFRESRKKAIEGREKTAMRHKIRNVVNDLNQYLLKGTKDKHVPIELQKAVALALDSVNMDTVGAEERIARLKDELMRAESPEKAQEISRKIDNISSQGGNLKDKLTALKAAYDGIINSDDPIIANSHDEVISNKIESVKDAVGDTALRDMSLDQLNKVYEMYKMVLKSVRDANKTFMEEKGEAASELAREVIDEEQKLKQKPRLRKDSAETVEQFSLNNLKPVYLFNRLGSKVLNRLFGRIRAAEDVWAADMAEANLFREAMFKKYNYKSWDFDKKYDFTSTTGHKFSLSLDQIMSLYALSKRDQAAAHLEIGGFAFDGLTEVKDEKNKLIKYKLKDPNAYNLSDKILADIVKTLDDFPGAREFVDEMQKYLAETMGEKGNEVSLKLYDIKLFKDKNYFPLIVSDKYLARAKEKATGDAKIKNRGFTKETKPNANSPVVLSSFMDVWASHVNDMSMYHAFTLPLEDFYRVYNFKVNNTADTDALSVVSAIEGAHGNAAVKCIDQLLKDINGGAVSDPTETISKKMISSFKKAAVLLSLSVVIQQPSAIVRAKAYISPKYFVGGKVSDGKHAEVWAEIKKYAPVAIIKEMGSFDTGMGRGAVKWLKGDKSAMDTFDDIVSRPAALADELTWCAIWNAVKRETMHNHPNLNPKTEEFLKAAGERFTEVIVKTQVYDSTLSRSANMRSKSAFMQMATAFMAEPTTSINMLEDAFRSGNKKFIGRVIGAVYGSVLLNSILVSFIYALRDDDDDETFIEKYFSHLATELIDGINPLTYIPFVKDIWSVAQGFDVERADMTLITNTFDAFQQLVKVATRDTSSFNDEERAEHNKALAEAIFSITDGLAALKGIPLKNVRREVNGFINGVGTIIKDVTGRPTTWGSLWDVIGDDAKNSLPVLGWLPDESRGDKLYYAIISGDEAYEQRLRSTYKNESTINSAIRRALRDNDKRIKEAAIAKNSGDNARYEAIALEILNEGFFRQSDIAAAINAEINELNKDNKPESEVSDKEVSWFTIDDYFVSIQSGDKQTADHVREEIINTYIANGRDRDEAEAAFDSSLRSSLRKYDSRIRDAAMAQYKLDVQGRIAIQKEILAEKNFSWDNIRLATSAEVEFIYDKIKDAKKAMDSGNTKVYDDIIEELIERGYPEDFILKALKK